MILWFSGTGNSRWVAEQLSTRLSLPTTELRPSVLSSPLRISPETRSIIWVCPVYSWGIPPYLRSIIGSLVIEGEGSSVPVHHLILTCGDDCGLAPEMWRHDIAKRGWTAGNVWSVIMPNNYVCMKGFNVDSKQLEAEKLAAAPARFDSIADSLSAYVAGTATDDVVRGSFAWIKTKVIYPWFIHHAMSPRPFHHTDACISCGKCAQICPLDNIRMEASSPQESGGRKYPVWDSDCAGCLACYHICPRHAVMYGKATAKKGQYFNPFL